MSGLLGRVLQPRRQSPAGGSDDDRAAAVQRLVDALVHAELLEDRRAAAQALRSSARQYGREIGAGALPRLIGALGRDAHDYALVRAVLAALVAVCSGPEGGAACGRVLRVPGSLGAIARFLGRQEDAEPWDALFETCTLLLVLHGHDAQTTALRLMADAPEAVANMSAALGAVARREVRDGAASELLLLLVALLGSSGAVRRAALFSGMAEEALGVAAGRTGNAADASSMELGAGALCVMRALLVDNPSGQRYVCETPSVLGAVLPLLHDLVAAGAPAISVLVSLLDALCALVPPEYSPRLAPVQETLLRAGLSDALCSLAQADVASVSQGALRLLRLLLVRNPALQRKLARTAVVGAHYASASSWRPRVPAVLAFLRAMLARDGPCADAADVLGAYLDGNADGQLAIASTLRAPEGADGEDLSAGSLIASCLLDGSVVAAAEAMALVLCENAHCKQIARDHVMGEERMLRAVVLSPLQAAADALTRPSLPEACGLDATHLPHAEGGADQSRAGDLLARLGLLAVWMHRSPETVAAVLASGADVQALVELCSEHAHAPASLQGAAALCLGLAVLYHPESAGLSFSRADLADVLRRRIGGDVLVARLAALVSAAGPLDARAHDAASALGMLSALRRVLFSDYVRVCLLFSERPGHAPSISGVSRAVQTDEEDILRSHALESDALRAQLSEALSALASRDAQLVQAAAARDALAAELAVRASDAGPGALEAHLRAENARLGRLAEAYAAQMLAAEREHEEVLVQLAAAEAETRQLREHLDAASGRTGGAISIGRTSPSAPGSVPASVSVEAAAQLPVGSLYVGIDAQQAAQPPSTAPPKRGGLLAALLGDGHHATTSTDV